MLAQDDSDVLVLMSNSTAHSLPSPCWCCPTAAWDQQWRHCGTGGSGLMQLFCCPGHAWLPPETSPPSPAGTPHPPGAVALTATASKHPTDILWEKIMMSGIHNLLVLLSSCWGFFNGHFFQLHQTATAEAEEFYFIFLKLPWRKNQWISFKQVLEHEAHWSLLCIAALKIPPVRPLRSQSLRLGSPGQVLRRLSSNKMCKSMLRKL